MTVGVLLLAKAPVPGLAKTRIGAVLGDAVAAELAAAALLDTLETVATWVPPRRRLVALVGDLADAARADEVAASLRGWRVIPQRGAGFADRLVNAHHDAARLWGCENAVLQLGTDTPQLAPADLEALTAPLRTSGRPDVGVDAMLGPATDGGWWGLATRRAGYVDGLAEVAMSTADTARETVAALRAAGAVVGQADAMSDVDLVADAVAVAASAPGTRFAQAVRALRIEAAA